MERTVHVNCDDIFPFCELMPITDTCIVVYMWHLYRKMQEKMLLKDFKLVDPVPVEYVPSKNQNIDFIQEQLNKRASYLSSRLIGTSTGQLVVVPCNIGFHWILTILNVEKEIVYLLDPLRHRIHDQDWKYVVNMALTLYNAEAGRKGKKQPTWEVVKAPRQPDAKQCGFYIMRYMKDIIENFGVGDKESLPSMFTNLKYSLVEINEVRSEWAECMLDYI
ncbi:uncharacterized protein LOC141818537 [Curcuma longa]|uniref:uncharacterized protein LOC141818537 n=1 Tax=Curcuma longa TaxID=136217 RepID=UPI003D9E217B